MILFGEFAAVPQQLRGSCILLRGCFAIQSIDPLDVSTRNQVSVGLDRDLDRTVPHLFLHVSERGAVFGLGGSRRYGAGHGSGIAAAMLVASMAAIGR